MGFEYALRDDNANFFRQTVKNVLKKQSLQLKMNGTQTHDISPAKRQTMELCAK